MPGERKPAANSAVDLSGITGLRNLLFPATFVPMLASLGEQRFSNTGWLFEPKMDGIRGVAMVRDGKARILSRRGLDLTSQYPVLAAELPQLVTGDAILDGEIIALNELGRPSFQQLQQRMNLTREADVLKAEQKVPVYYFVFDIVQFSNYSLTGVKLQDRKKVLEAVLSESTRVRRLTGFPSDGRVAYEACIDNGFEGVVAKRLDSPYECGRRSPYWLKVKAQQTAEFVLGGYTPGEGSRATTFGSLLLGYFDQGKFVYSGSVGTGFDDRLLWEVMRRIQPLRATKCPFLHKPADKRDAIWLTPEIVVEIKFMDWTRDGHLRAPVFLHFRDDKVAAEINRQEAIRPFEEGNPFADESAKKTPGKRTSAADSLGAIIREQVSEADKMSALHAEAYASVLGQLDSKFAEFELLVDNEKVAVSSLDKVLWPKDSRGRVITKRDYLKLLVRLSRYMLPYLTNRPLTLIRSPDGIKGKKFYQKHWNFSLPEYLETVRVTDPEAEAGYNEHLVCNNLPTLLFLAQHGVLEFHTTTSRLDPHPDIADLNQFAATAAADHAGYEQSGTISSALLALLDYPDFLVFDLDYHVSAKTLKKNEVRPIDVDAFKRVCELALKMKVTFDSLKLPPFVKTSGRNGLHIFVPIVRNLPYPMVRGLAETITKFVVKSHPELVTAETSIKNREGKVFLDYSPNGNGRTCVTAYSPRATLEATVSMPVAWSQLDKCAPSDFDMHNVLEHLSDGDIWSNIIGSKADLQRIIGGGKKI